MKRISKTIMLTSLAVILATPAFAVENGFTEVTDLASFQESFVEAKIMDPQDQANFFVIRNDGSIDGSWYGKELKGEWRWEDSYFCRSLSAPRPAPEDCQLWAIAEGKARLVRNRGDGEETIYDLGE